MAIAKTYIFMYDIFINGDDNMKFNEIFNNYINLIGCTSKDISNISKLSESIISRYKNGTRVPNNDTLDLLSNTLSTLSNNKYNKSTILNDFYNATNISNIDFSIVVNNLNTLINTFNINASTLSKFLNYDASYLSRIRNNTRIPSNKEEFIDSLTNFILKKYNNEKYNETLINLINNDINFNNIKTWLLTNKVKETNNISNFLNKLDEFDLNDFIKSIKFDELKVPTIPFYKAKTKSYYGIEEMKKGELDFFKATVLSKSKEDIFMCSDMPMEDMAKDTEFGKKWMFGIALSLKKGLNLNIIHNLDRPFNEMMLGLESWIPLYMTGQVKPYYFKDIKNNIYHHINYKSGSVILTGECINNNHDKGKYYISTNNKELEYYKTKCDLLLKKSNSLMDIYRKENIDKFNIFMSKDKDIKCDRKRIYSTLPLFTINDNLLLKILKRNKINKTDIDKILNYKKEEELNTLNILKTNKINDIIYKIDKKDFNNKIYLSLENIFYDIEIKYTYEEYLEHYNNTINYKNNNYIVSINEYKTFNNININILKNKYVHLTKSGDPIIHFIIRHPKLMDAIANFTPLVKE